MITERSLKLIELHRHYRRSVFPFSGGLLEQPNAYLEAMEIIEAAENE